MWSLPAGKTCPGSTSLCRDKCYARKAERQYPSVLPCRAQNYIDSKKSSFSHNMIALIKKSPAVRRHKLFRIHESGDFYSQAYLQKWIKICAALPEIQFLAFTKSFKLDYSMKPKNLQIVWSIWPDTKNAPKTGKFSIAGNCKTPKNTAECVGNCDNCGICWKLDQGLIKAVHFNIH